MRRLALLSTLAVAIGCDAGDPITGFTPANLPATRLAISVQPSNAQAQTAISPPIQVLVQNANNQTVTTSSLPVTLSITSGTGASGAVLTGQLIVDAVNGVATFNNVRVAQPGTAYTLTATSGSLASAVTTAFDITP